MRMFFCLVILVLGFSEASEARAFRESHCSATLTVESVKYLAQKDADRRCRSGATRVSAWEVWIDRETIPRNCDIEQYWCTDSSRDWNCAAANFRCR